MTAAIPAAMTSRPLTALPIVDQLCAILDALFRGCRGTVPLVAGRGTIAQKYYLHLPQPLATPWARLLPEPILRELAYAVPDDLRIPLASFNDNAATASILDVPAAWVEIPTPYTFDGAAGGRGWYVPAAVAAAATAKLAAFSRPVSLLIDQAGSLLAVWLLAEPVRADVKHAADAQLGRLMLLQARIAAALGGRDDEIHEAFPRAGVRVPGEPLLVDSVEAWHPRRPVMRIPGSHNRDMTPGGMPVTLVHADVSRRYTFEEMESAVKTRPNGRTKEKGQ